MAGRPREVIIPLYTTLMISHPEYFFHLWCSQNKEDKDLLTNAQRKAIEMDHFFFVKDMFVNTSLDRLR